MSQAKEPRLPWYGYVLLNVIVWVLTLGLYILAKDGFLAGDGGALPRPGLASLLVFIPVCFLAASLYDALYDRFANRQVLERPSKPAEQADKKGERRAEKRQATES